MEKITTHNTINTMEYIIRDKSIITGKANLEPLYTFKDFPVFMGCTHEMNASKDITADMSFDICRDTGIIQLNKLIPLELVYQNQHNDGVGKIWQDHYRAFSQFLEQFSPKRILEIGGANDFIASDFLSRNNEVRWTIIEPHPIFIETDQIKIIQGWFDDQFTYDGEVDTIVHSHVLEHTYEPLAFIQHISKFLKIGGKHIFTFPNMVEMLSHKYTNCLNFEHTAFLTEPFVDAILQNNGFRVLRKEYYLDHSIFYATEKIEGGSFSEVLFPNRYEEYKKLFWEFIEYHVDLINSLNKKMADFDGEIYLFGAHIFSQFLIEFGLSTTKIVALLDNSKLKEDKRLYGSTLFVKNPTELQGKGRVGVILKVGIYREEIVKQIKEINPEIVIID